jgi:hypothetical protein
MLVLALQARISVSRVSSYKVSVGSTTVRTRDFRAARSVVIDAITKLLAQGPDSVAGGAVGGTRHCHGQGGVHGSMTGSANGQQQAG